MSVAKLVRDFVDRVEDGKVFTYDDIRSDKKSVIAIELSRLSKQGVVKRLSKGRYYKPKAGRFGDLPPSDAEVVKSYTKPSKAYITGLKAFNEMGLTTQVPNTITIASDSSVKKVRVKNMTLKFVPIKRGVKKAERDLARMLDALENIKKIPDTEPDDVVRYVKDAVSGLSDKERSRLFILTKKYRPRTRAIIGAIFKELGDWEDAYRLKDTLNPMTTYKVGLSETVLKEKTKWKIQ